MSCEKRGNKRRPSYPDIAIRPSAAALLLAAAGALDSRGATITSTWNASSGSFNWTDPAHWTNAPAANTYPDNGRLGNTYDVVVSQGGPKLDTAVTVRSLTLSSGSSIGTGLYNPNGSPNTGTNSISITDAFTLNANSLLANVNTLSGSTLTLGNPGVPKLLAGSFNIGGELKLAPTAGTYLISTEAYGAVVNLLSTSHFTLDRPFSFYTSNDPFGSPVLGYFNNAGIIQQTAAGTFTTNSSYTRISNSGTIHVNGVFNVSDFGSTGLFDLQSASAVVSLSGSALSGQVTVAAGAQMLLGASWWVSLQDVSVTNAGTIQIQGAQVFGSVNISGSGLISFTNSGILQLMGSIALDVPTLIDNGQITGTNRASASNLTFKSGQISQSELYIPANGVLSMPGTNGRSLSQGATLTIAGNATWDGGTISSSSSNVKEARIQILSGGSLAIRPSATASLDTSSGLGATFANAGLLTVDHAALNLSTNTRLDNSGTIRLTSGTLVFSGNNATNSGTVDVQAGSTFSATGSGFAIAPAGVLHLVPSATANIGGLINAGLINLEGGKLTFSQSLNNTGTLRTTSGQVASAFGARATNSGLIDIAGAIATFEVFNNSATGIFRVGSGATVNLTSASASPLINAGLIEQNGGILQFTYGVSNSGTIRANAAAFSTNANNLTNTGSIDLRSGGGIVLKSGTSTSLDKVRAMIISGRNGGAWNGNGIQSTTAQSNASAAVGYASGISTTWMGLSVSSSDILVRQTLLGDTNLDGTVDFNDLAKMAQYYNKPLSASVGSWWMVGDFNYDGQVDFLDLASLAQNYNTALTAAPIPGATPSFEQDLAAAFASVPEPGSVAQLLAVGGLMIFGWRPRRRTTT